MKTLYQIATALLFLTFLPIASAEEKNGLLVNVTKRTLNRADRRYDAYYTRYDRTQGYKVNIKATAPKPFPEGELTWTIVVKKYLSTSLEKYTGTEKLKALRPSEALEMMIGAVPIQGYRYTRDYKDEMEYEISITHAGKETMRLASTANFPAMAKRAVLVRTPEEDPAEAEASTTTRPAPRNATPTTPQATRPTAPPTVVPTTPAPQPAPVTPTPPAQTPPNTGNTTPPAPAQDSQFDFFNLNKNKTPKAN